jgi:glucose-1-phosphate thymidylyltransferase
MAKFKDNIEYVGLIPAGGKAERISPLPCSKEIFPVGFGDIRQKGQIRPKVAAHYLLEKMRLAGAEKAYFVLAKGKWDIPAYFGNGSFVNMAIGYLMTDLPYGVPFTIDSAVPFLKTKHVLFGFPDIIFQPDDAYAQLVERMHENRADIVLGLFLAENPQKMDMVDFKADGTIGNIHLKPLQTKLKWTWIIAVWNEAFTQFMHDFVRRQLMHIATAESGVNQGEYRELFLGDVIRETIGSELKIDQVMFPQGTYIDIGSPEDIVAAIRTHADRSTHIKGHGKNT